MAPGPLQIMESSRAVLRALTVQGSITRPRLGALLALSKPTMSAAIAELQGLGLVEQHGSEKGPLGRTAVTYRLGANAGFVVGIDSGATRIRAVAYSLDGDRLAAADHPVTDGAGRSEAVWASAQSVIRASGPRPLRSVAVAVPRIVSADRVRADSPDGPAAVLGRLRARVEAPVILENNVNCAAIGELHSGVARGRSTFAYLQVGVRIGLGIVSEGRLFRGAGGGAGEVGRLPFPWSPDVAPTREGLEHHLGSGALIERCAIDWPAAEWPPPDSAKALFERAAQGSIHAMRLVERHAGEIGRLVAGCIGLLDPGLVVLGGGVGQNPLLRREVERVATDLTWPTEVAVSSLGDDGTMLGAMRLAADYSIGLLLNEDRHPAVVLPPPESPLRQRRKPRLVA